MSNPAMNFPPEMVELMNKSVAEHFAAYWQKHATEEQEEKRKVEGKTFEGAAKFVQSVAAKHRTADAACVAMPDELAYWLLMEYMEHGTEGTEYKTTEEIEAEARREVQAEKDRARAARAREKAEAEKIAAKMKEAQLTLF